MTSQNDTEACHASSYELTAVLDSRARDDNGEHELPVSQTEQTRVKLLVQSSKSRNFQSTSKAAKL